MLPSPARAPLLARFLRLRPEGTTGGLRRPGATPPDPIWVGPALRRYDSFPSIEQCDRRRAGPTQLGSGALAPAAGGPSSVPYASAARNSRNQGSRRPKRVARATPTPKTEA